MLNQTYKIPFQILPMERMRLSEIIYTEEEMQELREENKKLKSDLAFERTMLDNVRAEYKSLQNIIKKLIEENETLKEELISRIRQPKNVPY